MDATRTKAKTARNDAIYRSWLDGEGLDRLADRFHLSIGRVKEIVDRAHARAGAAS